MTDLEFVVPQELDGITVLSFLRSKCGVSYRMIKRLRHTPMGITANGAYIRTIDTLKGGDRVRVTLPSEENSAAPVPLPIEVIFEDEQVIVVNKPSGMPVHQSAGHIGDTLANALAAHFVRTGQDAATSHVINRLDRDTTGLVLLAKNKYAAALLSDGGKKRGSELRPEISKTYYAICQGALVGSGTIDAAIRVMEGHGIQREVGAGGARAITHWFALKNTRVAAPNGIHELTLLRIALETGRTHQIRVHFSAMGMPLAGDDMYGGSRALIGRQALHCGKLSFIHPVTHERISLAAPIPADMRSIMGELN